MWKLAGSTAIANSPFRIGGAVTGTVTDTVPGLFDWLFFWQTDSPPPTPIAIDFIEGRTLFDVLEERVTPGLERQGIGVADVTHAGDQQAGALERGLDGRQ